MAEQQNPQPIIDDDKTPEARLEQYDETVELPRLRKQFMEAMGHVALVRAKITVQGLNDGSQSEAINNNPYNQEIQPKSTSEKIVAARLQKKINKHAESIDEKLVGKSASKTFLKTIATAGKISEKETLKRNNGLDDLRLRSKATIRAIKKAEKEAKKKFKRGEMTVEEFNKPHGSPVYRSGTGRFTGSAGERARQTTKSRAEKVKRYGEKLAQKAEQTAPSNASEEITEETITSRLLALGRHALKNNTTGDGASETSNNDRTSSPENPAKTHAGSDTDPDEENYPLPVVSPDEFTSDVETEDRLSHKLPETPESLYPDNYKEMIRGLTTNIEDDVERLTEHMTDPDDIRSEVDYIYTEAISDFLEVSVHELYDTDIVPKQLTDRILRDIKSARKELLDSYDKEATRVAYNINQRVSFRFSKETRDKDLTDQEEEEIRFSLFVDALADELNVDKDKLDDSDAVNQTLKNKVLDKLERNEQERLKRIEKMRAKEATKTPEQKSIDADNKVLDRLRNIIND